jgi:hypothetical protein
MSDVNISKFRAQVVRDGSKPATPGFVVSEGQSPTDPAGSGQNHLPVTIAAASTGLAITESQVLGGAGTVAQYIRGDGSLADFPATTGGGSSVSYYLNGSVSQGTIGGVAYLELNKMPVFGAGTDITRNSNGYIASFITDAGDPNKLLIPAGNWNLETYFSASSGGGSPTFYVELYKYDGTTFTLIATSSGTPELIAFGTNINPYFSTLAVPETILTLTDRLALRYYVTTSGRTITLHTENNHLCQVITTFTTGLTALNGLTTQVQFFAVGTSGTDFNIASSVDTHTFNLPTASATNRGALSSTDWTTFNNKENAITAGTTAQYFRGDKTFQTLNTSVVPEGTNLYYTEARVNANTNVAANTAARHNAVTLGTANGLSLSTQVLSLGLASAGVTGALSGTDWSTFNSKQNALTNPVTGTGTTNFLPKFTGTSTIGDSVIADNATEINITKRIFLNSGGQSIFFTPNLSSSSNRIEGSSGVPLEIFTSGSELRFAAGGVSTQVTLLSSGNVGIGTTAPAKALEVLRSGNSTSQIKFGDASVSKGYLGVFSNAFYITSGGTFDSGWSTDGSNGISNIVLETTNGGSAIAFGTASSNTSPTERMRITSGGNLLVGTTTDAGFKLDVNGTGRFTSSVSSTEFKLNNVSTLQHISVYTVLKDLVGRNAILLGDTNDPVNYYDNSEHFFRNRSGSPYVSILSNGNVGIGTTSPLTRLMVQDSANTYVSHFSGLNQTNGIAIGTNSSNVAVIQGYTRTFGATNNIAMQVDGGNLLVGTTTDAGFKLDVNGTGRFVNNVSGGATNVLTITNAASTVVNTETRLFLSTVTGNDRGAYISAIITSASNDNALTFATNSAGSSPSERMRITSGGNVLIGTTTDSGAKLQVNGAVNSRAATTNAGLGATTFIGAGEFMSTGSLAGYFWENRSGGVTSTSNWYGWYTSAGTIFLYNGSANIASINTSTGAYTALSDKNKKKDFEQSNLGLNEILNLKPTLYRMNSDSADVKKQLGFIAQEVKDYIPQAYVESEDFIGLNYNSIIPVLVNAIKELKQEIDTLKN